MENTVQFLIKRNLASWAEPDYAHFSSALIPHLSRPMLGVRLPQLRAFAKSLVKAHTAETLLSNGALDTFEEVMLKGLLLGYLDLPWQQRWKEISDFVPLIDNWSVCDSCCATYVSVRDHRAEVFPALLQFLQSEEEFTQRFAVVMLMDHFLVDEYIPQVLQAWLNTAPAGYYVEMAIGWGLSVAALHDPEATLEVMAHPALSAACRKKACRKILESKRSSEELRRRVMRFSDGYKPLHKI